MGRKKERTAEAPLHHRGSADGVRDRGEAVIARLNDPFLPVRVRAAVAVVRDGLEARDGLSGSRQVTAHANVNMAKATSLQSSDIPERSRSEDLAGEACAGDLHGEIEVDAEVVDLDLGLRKGVVRLVRRW